MNVHLVGLSEPRVAQVVIPRAWLAPWPLGRLACRPFVSFFLFLTLSSMFLRALFLLVVLSAAKRRPSAVINFYFDGVLKNSEPLGAAEPAQTTSTAPLSTTTTTTLATSSTAPPVTS